MPPPMRCGWSQDHPSSVSTNNQPLVRVFCCAISPQSPHPPTRRLTGATPVDRGSHRPRKKNGEVPKRSPHQQRASPRREKGKVFRVFRVRAARHFARRHRHRHRHTAAPARVAPRTHGRTHLSNDPQSRPAPKPERKPGAEADQRPKARTTKGRPRRDTPSCATPPRPVRRSTS